MSITAVLNGYKRPYTLQEQYQAIKNQKCNCPVDIMYWQNTVDGLPYPSLPDTTSAICSSNLGVWARFTFALNARTEFVCVFDDDTIPGSLWFQNCLDSYERQAGLYGTIGVIFTRPEYSYFRRVGWDCPNNDIQQADIVGHAWFMHRDILSVMFRELPPLNQVWCVGEDIHLSHMIQKYTNLKTFVPPHPQNRKELWGSLQGVRYGADVNQTWSGNGHHMDAFLKRSIANGFKLMCQM